MAAIAAPSANGLSTGRLLEGASGTLGDPRPVGDAGAPKLDPPRRGTLTLMTTSSSLTVGGGRRCVADCTGRRGGGGVGVSILKQEDKPAWQIQGARREQAS